MRLKGLTLSIIFEAQSGNYGEGFGNIQVLKKLSRGDGGVYSYISRQALRYNIINQLGWDNTPVEGAGGGAKKVVQFAPSAKISDYPEIDLFGYMKTAKGESGNSRSAIVRLSHAIALENYHAEMDYLTNMALSSRGKNLDNSISQSEIHQSFYAYTITIDLDRVGKETDQTGTVTEEIPDAEKAARVVKLLKTVQFLYRDIKGRRENLAPVFAIGGVYNRKNPYFEGRLRLNKCSLDTGIIKEMFKDEDVRENTLVGLLDGILDNSTKIKDDLVAVDINSLFDELKGKVEGYYSEGNKN
ncbi:type I-B CRISPR-associated protein Cas7/Cst2/DevR [Phosphitispora fastidiosa]|uniref:type I-B CRISPR-associated protein Cas7/Cst2/DevR n=1 Tax=Phosphitispora fastidiosa TaxID=2837202 RepID=UPI001E582CB3|nr:type I-B CRISPR-associated protein Cas7/Cst2/DevR [Phosphitispora fastidiosa]